MNMDVKPNIIVERNGNGVMVRWQCKMHVGEQWVSGSVPYMMYNWIDG